MNSNAKKFIVRPCIVCGYIFSDRHHVYPKARQWTRKSELTVYLCPNHHRYANMIQVMLKNRQEIPFIKAFADENFDADFNEKALYPLIEHYRTVDQARGDLAARIFEEFFGGFDDRTE